MIGIITPFFDGKPYHSKYSGYERLISYVPKKKIYFTIIYPKLSIFFYPLRILGLFPKMYRSFKSELECLKENDSIFHLYGEDTFFLSGFKLFRKNKKIVVTFHQPEQKFKQKMPFYWRWLLKDIDIIVLSPSQKNFFIKYFPETKIHLIPHGIDTNFFKPNPKIKKKNQIIAVGNHLRNYPILLKAMEVINKTYPELKLYIVAKKINDKFNANFEFLDSVSDKELLKLYQQSLFQVLPLKAATANNALLEGCACGLPLISIDSMDLNFYYNNIITYNSEKDLVEKILYLYKNKVTLNNINSLSWEVITPRLMELFYEKK